MKIKKNFYNNLLLIGFISAFSCSLSAQLKKVPSTPIPKIEVGAHLDRTTGLAIDTLNHRVISAGDDRTIRVWDLITGRIEKTLRVPIDNNKEGELYGLAYEPKSQTIAVSGWTGLAWSGVSVYVFDLPSGKMMRPLEGFSERVTALAYSEDGQRLAVMLTDGKLFLYKTPTDDNSSYEFIAHNEDCQGISDRMDFSNDGRLVTNCFDGVVRVFNQQLQLITESKPEGGDEASGVDFSPDGRLIAVGFNDTNVVTVLDSATLEEKFRPDTSVIDQEQQAPQVAWSATGSVLYAAGDLHDDSDYHVISWDNYGRGEPKIHPASAKRIFRMLAMPNAGVVYTTLEHAVGILDEQGERSFYSKPPIIDHQFHQSEFRISADGDTVMFLAKIGSEKQYVQFSLHARSLVVADALDESLLKPIIEHVKIQVTNWSDSRMPLFNGEPISLYENQRSHSMAIDPNGKFFTLGMDAELRRFDQQGEVEWPIYPLSTAFALNITADGEMIVGAFEDGSIRWFRSSDGHEIMALFIHENLQDWVVWVPAGFFLSSPEGDKHIGWQLNNGKDDAPDFYTAFQFERLLYRPDLVDRYFNNRGYWERSQADITQEFSVSDLRESAPPDIEVTQVNSRGISENSNSIEIEVNIQKRNLPIKEYLVFVNGLPVLSYDERQLSAAEKDGFKRTHKIPLSTGLNEMRVEALTEKSMGLRTAYFEQAITDDLPVEDQQSDLYILGIGVNELIHSPGNSLDYAVADAQAFTQKFSTERLKEFDNVHIKLLTDNSDLLPTRENISAQLSFFRSSGPNDTVILYLAAHGISNKAGDYFLLPRDATDEDIKLLLDESNESFNPDSMIKWESFFNALRDASGKRLLIVDSCQARKIQGNFDAGSLIKRSSAASFALMAASKGAEESYEFKELEHGVFTYALLNGLNDIKIDENSNGNIELSELFGYVSDYVSDYVSGKAEEFASRIKEPQTPQLYSPDFLLNMSLNQLENTTAK